MDLVGYSSDLKGYKCYLLGKSGSCFFFFSFFLGLCWATNLVVILHLRNQGSVLGKCVRLRCQRHSAIRVLGNGSVLTMVVIFLEEVPYFLYKVKRSFRYGDLTLV